MKTREESSGSERAVEGKEARGKGRNGEWRKKEKKGVGKKEKHEATPIHRGPNYIRIGVFEPKGWFPRNRCVRWPISRPLHVFILSRLASRCPWDRLFGRAI